MTFAEKIAKELDNNPDFRRIAIKIIDKKREEISKKKKEKKDER
jgi:hypothetical protein